MQTDYCKTRYPILLLHGAHARDEGHYRFWGRIPDLLRQNGAQVFTGGQDAWGSIEGNAQVIDQRLMKVLAQTGSPKVNIIAHSKGGLEARYLISVMGRYPHVASLSTVSTPHHGCRIVDFFEKWPDWFYRGVSACQDFYWKKHGDAAPDFYTASRELSTHACREFAKNAPDMPGVFYQSWACAMSNPFGDPWYMGSYLLEYLLAGENDGLVSVKSAKWGEFRGVLRTKGIAGISHNDAGDVRERDFKGMDIPRVYIKMAHELKEKGF